MHHDLVVEKDPVWIKVSRVVIHVMRYSVKARAWRGLGVVVVFVVGIVFVLRLSVALVCFVVDVHTLYVCRRGIDSLHNVVRAASFILQFFFFCHL